MSEAITQFLASTPLFADLGPDDVARLAAAMTVRHIRAGEVLVSEGDVATSLFLVMNGRLRVYVTGDAGTERAVGEIGLRDIVGEMSLLSSGARSATVRAVRDTRLLELQSADFTNLVLEQPRTLLEVTRTLVTRLERSIHARAVGGGPQVITVVPAGTATDHRVLGANLAAEMRTAESVEIVDCNVIEGRFGPGSAEAQTGDPVDAAVTEWLHHLELDTDHLVLVSDDDDSPWTRRCLREADRILLVGQAAERPEHSPAEHLIDDPGFDPIRARVDLVLTQPEWLSVPFGTRHWTRTRTVHGIHHLRSGDKAGVERLARVLSGRSVGVVLSGGGARGFAHIGVLRAIREAEIPIDHVGGTSFGAVVAAMIAMGLPVPEMIDDLVAVTVGQGSLIDITAPAIAIARGVKLSRGIREGFGGAEIEDLWIDFYCASADLTAGALRIHDAGPVWKALRASVAIPGAFPPVRAEDGHVLVDGGIMNNLPLDIMHRDYEPGVVLGVDLRAGIALPSADLDDGGVASGWKVLGRRLNPWSAPLEVPHLMDILLRVTEIASGEQQHVADVMFRPPVADFKLLDFKAYRDIIDVGYRHAVEVLEQTSIGI